MPEVRTPIAQLRHSRGLTQRELADAAGLAPDTVARLERGERTPRGTTALQLADALGAPVGDVLVRTAATKNGARPGAALDNGGRDDPRLISA